MTIILSLPFDLQNGTPADATQVMADFNEIVDDVNANAAANGANSDITSLSGLTTPLSISQGGTGANTAPTALSNLGGIGPATTDTLTNKTISGASNTITNINDTAIVFTDNTTGNASSSKHGYLPKLTGNSTDVLLGDGSFGKIASGSAVSGNFKNIVTSTTAGTITASSVIVNSSGGGSIKLSNVNVSYSTGTSGANGLDTGSIAASTWYYVYIIYNPTTVTIASLISASATSPTLPSGYTFFQCLGEIRTDGSNDLIGTLQVGPDVQYLVGTNLANLPVMASGTTPGNVTSPGWVAVATGNFVPPTAYKIRFNHGGPTNDTKFSIVAPNTNYGGETASGSANEPISVLGRGSANTADDVRILEFLLESTNIYWLSNGSQHRLRTIGWSTTLV